MSEPWLRRPTGSAALLTALGGEYDVDPARLLEGTGLDVPALHNPRAEITGTQELRIVRNLVEAVPVAGLGFFAGRRYHLGTHVEWSYALVTSRTVRDAVEVALAFAELTYTFSRLRMVGEVPDERIVIDDGAVPVELRRFLLERDLAAFATTATTLLGGGPPPISDVALAVPVPGDPAHRAMYRDVLGTEPTWDAAEHALSCPPEVLERSITDSLGPEVALLARQACADALAQRRQREGFARQVRHAVLASPPAASQEQVAAMLHVSMRTMRRRLAEEGLTYRALVRDTWGEVAEDLLASGLTVEQVAARLGYAGPSSFTRAFKAWRGTSPGSYARRSREGSAIGPG